MKFHTDSMETRVPTVKFKIPEKNMGKAGYRTSVRYPAFSRNFQFHRGILVEFHFEICDDIFSTSRISQSRNSQLTTIISNSTSYLYLAYDINQVTPTHFQYKPGELSMPPSDRATLSNISKQFSKTIIFCRIGLFSATFISSNKVVFRSNSFEDDKQSTFIRFISRSEAILGDFCLGQSDARAESLI